MVLVTIPLKHFVIVNPSSMCVFALILSQRACVCVCMHCVEISSYEQFIFWSKLLFVKVLTIQYYQCFSFRTRYHIFDTNLKKFKYAYHNVQPMYSHNRNPKY